MKERERKTQDGGAENREQIQIREEMQKWEKLSEVEMTQK